MNKSDRDQNRRPPEGSESGGLFSDAPAPKRENPYLRKKKATPAPAPSANTQAPAADVPATPRKRTFADFLFEHVKLIAAIATILVVISLVIITDVTGWIADFQFRQEQKDKIPLTIDHIQRLVDRGDPITWSDLTRYARDDTDVTNDSVTWKFRVKSTAYPGADLELWISGADTEHDPTYVTLYDFTSGEHVNLNKDHLDLFLDKIENIPQE